MKIFLIVILIILVLVGAWWLVYKNSHREVVVDILPPSLSPSPSPIATVSSEGKPSSSPSSNLADQTKVLVTLKTVQGDITLELYPVVAPKTVKNFVDLAKKGFYDGLKFHRVVPGFVIQGGDPLSRTDDPKVGAGGPGYTFADEINPRSLGLPETEIKTLGAAGYKFNYNLQSIPIKVGVMAMANAGPNTNGSQFFIVTETDQPSLNGKYTAFGRVISGMEVVRAIKKGDVIKGVKFNL